MKIIKRILIGLLAVIILLTGTFFIYAGKYYKAESVPADIVTGDKEICMGDDNSDTGIIFYPGAKVEYKAYGDLMEACSEKGLFTVCVKMPFNFAFFDMDAAERVKEEYPEIKNWYIAGHSLGGAMAASYVSKNSDDFEGLILLASFSTADISDSGLKVLSIYGTEDEVLSMDSYEKNKVNLPEDFKEVVIDGGCHAFFGNYGKQKGDGNPEITREEQIKESAGAIIDLVKGE